MSSNHNWLVVGVVVVVASGKIMNKTPRNRSIYIYYTFYNLQVKRTCPLPFSQYPKDKQGTVPHPHAMGRVVGVIALVQPQPKRHLQTWECSPAGNGEQQRCTTTSRCSTSLLVQIVDHQTTFVSRTEQTIFSKLGWRWIYALYGYT